MGVVGMLFPFVLMVGLRVSSGHFTESSISYFYHTPMRDTFVATLVVGAIFLVTYRGMEKAEDYLTFVAGICAVGVAMVPMPKVPSERTIAGTLHLLFAGILFLTIAITAIYLFTLSGQRSHRTGTSWLRDNPLRMKDLPPKKRVRNGVYIFCGVIMLLSIAAMLLSGIADFKSSNGVTVMFICESITIIAFGVAWWTKGHGVPMGDPKPVPRAAGVASS